MFVKGWGKCLHENFNIFEHLVNIGRRGEGPRPPCAASTAARRPMRDWCKKWEEEKKWEEKKWGEKRGDKKWEESREFWSFAECLKLLWFSNCKLWKSYCGVSCHSVSSCHMCWPCHTSLSIYVWDIICATVNRWADFWLAHFGGLFTDEASLCLGDKQCCSPALRLELVKWWAGLWTDWLPNLLMRLSIIMWVLYYNL